MLTLGGVPLLCPQLAAEEGIDLTAVGDWVARNISPTAARPWLARAFPGSSARNLTNLSWPTGFEPAGPVCVNRLYWPGWGASRWGYAHFLASAAQTRQIRDLAYGVGGRGLEPLDLVLSSPGGRANETVATAVDLLPPLPLSGIRAVNGLYLLTVVEERYYWWSVPNRRMPLECVCTWEDVFTYCSQSLVDYGLGPIDSVGPIPADYRKPHYFLANLREEPLPIVLDSACTNVGMRLVRTLDGTVKVVGSATAQAALTAQLARPNRSLQAGGGRFLDVL